MPNLILLYSFSNKNKSTLKYWWQIRKNSTDSLLTKIENPLKRSKCWNCDTGLFVYTTDSLFNRFFTKLHEGNLISYPFTLQVTAVTQQWLTSENNCICFGKKQHLTLQAGDTKWQRYCSMSICMMLWQVKVGWHAGDELTPYSAVTLYLPLGRRQYCFLGCIYRQVNCNSQCLQVGGQNIVSELLSSFIL